jgi:hypothetical protein
MNTLILGWLLGMLTAAIGFGVALALGAAAKRGDYPMRESD